MNFKPVSNFVLVKPVEVPNTTPSGLALPETAQDRPNMGTVMAIGEGQRTITGELIPMAVQVNDIILFPKFSGTEVKLNKEKYLIMRDTDLYGIVANESKSD